MMLDAFEDQEVAVGRSFSDYFQIMNLSESSEVKYRNVNDAVAYRNFTNEWGPTRDPLYIVVPISIMYVIIFVSGVIGNVSTCVVIARNKSMHTATNYYLFSLAVSDLLLLVSGLPPEMYYIWCKYPYVFGEVFCIMQGFAAETSANATVLTITAFTIERYVAICHPFLSHTMSKLSRAIKFIIAIWVLAMCFAVPQAMSFGIVYELTRDGTVRPDHYVCAVKRQLIPHAFELSTLIFFVAPMSLISVLYILIALQLRKSKLVKRGTKDNSIEMKHRIPKSPGSQLVKGQNILVTESNLESPIDGRGSVGGDEGKMTTTSLPPEDGRKNYHHRNMHSRATKHVIKMLIAVVVAFFICWAPFHAQRLLAIHASAITPDIVALYTALTYMSGVLYYLSTCINPLLYNIMSNKFRNAFRETLSRYLGVGGRGSKPVRRYSTISLPRSVSPTRSQSLSHSGGHSSRRASLRYIDGDVYRRPLVVTFRRPNATSAYVCIHSSQCRYSRNGESRRAIYTPGVSNYPGNLAKRGDRKLLNKCSLKDKSDKLTKRERKKENNSVCGNNCTDLDKAICWECQRYLNASTTNVMGDEGIEIAGDALINDASCPTCNNLLSKDSQFVVESDLIPRHVCCSKHVQDEILEKSEGSNASAGIQRPMLDELLWNTKRFSRTMPDIVNYPKLARADYCGVSLNIHNYHEPTVNMADECKARIDGRLRKDKRKWGSAESVFSGSKNKP